jgi:hypothetical protein
LTNGGNRVRKAEFLDVCEVLKVKEFEILDKEKEGIRDCMRFKIKKSLIWREI